MTLEISSQRIVLKPWGRENLLPWSCHGRSDELIGEIWFERSDPTGPKPALMLKLLFADQPLSIQVHPDDSFARALDLPHGKTEAWYVLSALPSAEVTLGLDRSLTPFELRDAISDGSILDLAHRQVVQAGESLLVPAGTIHAIGAGLVIAEIQQRSDTTYRLFDYGRGRELHPDSAVGAAIAGPAPPQAPAERLSRERLVVATCSYFVVEYIELAPGSKWDIAADRETWVLLLEGDAKFDRLHLARGEAAFLDSQCIGMEVGASPVCGLLTYVGSQPEFALLQKRTEGPCADAIEFQARTPSQLRPALFSEETCT